MDNAQLQMQLIEGYNKRLAAILEDMELRKWCIDHVINTRMSPQEIYEFLTERVRAELASSATAPSTSSR